MSDDYLYRRSARRVLADAQKTIDADAFIDDDDAELVLDRKAVANRLLELLPPADDGELLTDVWLNGVSGDGWDHRGYSIEIGPLEFEPYAHEAGGPVTLTPDSPGVQALTTRGHVRRIALAMGLSLTEPQS